MDNNEKLEEDRERYIDKELGDGRGGAAAAASAEDKRESNATRLWRQLPDSHQTEDVREWLGAYFVARVASKTKRLADSTVDRQAVEYATYSPEVVAQAFKEATLAGWQGVFPNKVRIAQPAQQGPSSQPRAKETASEQADRIIAEIDAEGRNAA